PLAARAERLPGGGGPDHLGEPGRVKGGDVGRKRDASRYDPAPVRVRGSPDGTAVTRTPAARDARASRNSKTRSVFSCSACAGRARVASRRRRSSPAPVLRTVATHT